MAPNKSPNENGIVKRRNRIPLSCESCRLRKLKCDRQKPCQNCKARDMQAQCTYVADESAKSSRGPQLMANPDDMGERLQRLEALVGSLAKNPSGVTLNGGSAPGPMVPNEATNGYPSVETALQPSAPYGAMVPTTEGHHFIGESHWEALLRDISSIRESLEESKSQARPLPQDDSDTPALINGAFRAMSKRELLSSLPSKNLADRLLLRFWDAWNPSTPRVIHRPTFNNHFDEWWSNLEDLSYSRLGILFTIFATALHTYQMAGDEPPDLRGFVQELSNNYSQRAAHCIWASDITHPDADGVVGCLMHWVSEFYKRSNSMGLWMLQSLLIRQAISLGFHRDPSAFPNISPLDAELRRRAWHAICQSDLLLSFQLGLPSMVDYSQTDVATPRSLHEEELYENMESLPPERPMTEPTPVSYTIAKRHMFRVFEKVVRHVNTMTVPTDEQVDRLNKELADVYNNTFPHLRKKPWEEGVRDSLEVRMQRISMQTFYNKAICVLNRRYLMHRGMTEFSLACRALCIENAMELLDIQNTMQSAGYRWYQFLYTRNDFLLATIIICLALYTLKKPDVQVQGPWDPSPLTEESKLRRILDRARLIWMKYADGMPDARRACQIIDVMLQKSQNGQPNEPPPSVDLSIFSNQTPGTTSVNSITPESMQDLTNLDWSSWDTIIQGSNFDMPPISPESLWQLEGMKM